VAVAACGLCGTDLHIMQGEFAPELPIIPGHEFAGEVVAVGRDVTELAVGARVAVDPSLTCNECYYCRLGRNNLCERWAAIGVTTAGGAAEYAIAPVANCVVLPDHVSTQDAALIEPLACAVRGYDVLRSQLANHVLIYGSGTMGLMMLELAKRTGAAAVDMVDINPARLETARTLGCSNAVTSADELDMPRGWDLVIDATGNEKAIQDALGRVGKGGTYLQFGVSDYAAQATIEPYKIYNQEITITGIDGGPAQLRARRRPLRRRRARPGDLYQRPSAACLLRRGHQAVPGGRGPQDPGAARPGCVSTPEAEPSRSPRQASPPLARRAPPSGVTGHRPAVLGQFEIDERADHGPPHGLGHLG
jgi:2-desacetyl-2-hydroxyethyl bacteriochlorophyllide A dehydrogenase